MHSFMYALTTLLPSSSSLQNRKELLNLSKKFDFLLELNGGHGVSKYLFVLTILEHLGTLDRNKDIDPWVKV